MGAGQRAPSLASDPGQAGPTFLVTAPCNIRPGANVTVGVVLLQNSPLQVTVRGEVLRGNDSLLSGELVFEKGSFGILVLPALPLNSASGDYVLLVEGRAEGRHIFSNRTKLLFESKSISVFIQTDKSFYKPGQEVKFRIVTVYPDLKPYRALLSIYIRDPRGNLIQQWLSEKGDLGVVSKNFQLSTSPPLGDWSIQVQENGQTYHQRFTVVEYVLPKFEVTLKTSLYSSKGTDLVGTVTAKYTYGKPVKGTVTVICSAVLYWRNQRNITQTIEINGSVNFTFSYLEMQNLTTTQNQWYGSDFIYGGPIEITAIVTESLTGISQNSSTTVFPKQSDYIIEFSDYPKVLKPSLNFIATLKVMHSDNSPLTAEERQNYVTITAEQSDSVSHRSLFSLSENEVAQQGNESVHSLSYSVPDTGIVQIEIPILATARSLQMKASFLDSETSIAVHDVFNAPSKTYLQIKSPRQDVKAGTPFELSIASNRPIKEFNYMVVSKEQIVAFGKKVTTTFTLTAENSWAPLACIVIFYTSETGEVVNDVLAIPVQPVFENKITVSWSKDKVSPSEKVSLRISTTESRSVVGLSVVDKSAKLLGEKTDITEDVVLHELYLYNTKQYFASVRSPFSVFQKCNLWVLTDANLAEDEDPFLLLDTHFNFVDDDILTFMDSDTETHFPVRPPPSSYPYVRMYFPETWLWIDSNTRSSKDITMEVTVPDTITLWVASAFVMSENLGLGILTAPVELETFQPFFISLNLPYSVTRGEQFILEINIFNYLKEETKVTVTLDISDVFEILITSNEINATGNQQSVLVPSEDGRTVNFPIKPKRLGEIPIKVTAVSPTASDAVLQKVLVKAEGLEQSYSQAVLLDLTGNNPKTISKTLHFNFPSGVVSGSERVQVTAIGDILGPSINGLESLIKMPYGCGEQNMINFAPNIYVLEYLTKTRQLKEDIKSKAISFMREGYQRELLYQRDDGSFSAFGNSDSSGSAWLSAFVLRCFIQARPFIDIDPYVLTRTAAWIVKHQKHNGEFTEPGKVIHSGLQGGSNSPVTLTAYVVTTLLGYENDEFAVVIKEATSFLEAKLEEGISDNYTLTLVTYALSLANSMKAKKALNILNQKSEQQGEIRFWTTPAPELSDSWQPRSVDIELAAYALLSHFQQDRLSEGIPIMKWLSQQRNHLGGYSSTQDTVVALQALSSFAVLTTTSKTEISVTVTGPNLEALAEFSVDTQNRFLLQTKEIAPVQPMVVTLSAEGTGFAIFQLNIIYNMKHSVTHRRRRSAQSPEAFDLDVVVNDEKNDINHLTLNVCTRYLGSSASPKSGMALMEVGMLSGFSALPDFISLHDPIKKVEKDNGKVSLYLDSLNETQVCVDIPAVRDFKVANTQGASVIIVDYYEPRRKAVRSYNSEVMQKLSSCVFCESDCNLCEKKSTDGAQGLLLHSGTFLFCILLTILVNLL
ncbi:CD109 antigen isoform X3 [Alligator mississippiensis]|uniref:CD109 antigen isoform X3 n=1 Tax=Alligator mississippiensis TaxID=8496 RepID=UPI0009076C50|nr:CD109 antigen isoform X3 [Alligator mississippiensis]